MTLPSALRPLAHATAGSGGTACAGAHPSLDVPAATRLAVTPPAGGQRGGEMPRPGSTMVTLKEASALTSYSLDTHKRDLEAGRYPSAQQSGGRGTWMVSLKDLVAAGRLDPEHVEDATTELAARRECRLVAELRERVIRLETALKAAEEVTTHLRERCDALTTDKEQQMTLLLQLTTLMKAS